MCSFDVAHGHNRHVPTKYILSADWTIDHVRIAGLRIVLNPPLVALAPGWSVQVETDEVGVYDSDQQLRVTYTRRGDQFVLDGA